MAFGSATIIINGVKGAENGEGKDKPNGKKNDNSSGDSHDYLFIPRMASEPLKDSFHIGIYSLAGLLWVRQSLMIRHQLEKDMLQGRPRHRNVRTEPLCDSLSAGVGYAFGQPAARLKHAGTSGELDWGVQVWSRCR